MSVKVEQDITQVILAPGQGNQRPEMGLKLARRSPAAMRIWQRADDILFHHLGEKLSDIAWKGTAEQLQDTRIAQPAIVVDTLARKAAADEIGILGQPGWYAYLSLGSAASLVFAGSLTMEGAAQLTVNRGEAFNTAIEGHPPTSMVALVGVDESVRTRVLNQYDLVVCLENTDEEIVIGGLVDKIAAATADLSQSGFGKQVFPLKVAAAYHSKYIEPAQEEWSKVVDSAPIEAPKYGRIIGGTTITVLETAEAIRTELKMQLTNTERYRDVIKSLYALGVRTFKEMNDFRRLTGLNTDLLGVVSRRRLQYPAAEGETPITIGHELQVPDMPIL